MESTRTLVIGGGLAGLYCALNAAVHGNVTLVMKSDDDCSTRRAQGGVAAAIGVGDSPARHLADTLSVGAGLCRRPIVGIAVREARAHIERLRQLGVEFCSADGHSLDLALEGGHTARRVAHVDDTTGAAIYEALRSAVAANGAITVRYGYVALDLLMADGPTGRSTCVGASILEEATGLVRDLRASGVVIATGGIGAIYHNTTNPRTNLGDGIALAWRAGAALVNMEFVQFHPTVLAHPGAEGFLLSEALRGEGGVLRRADGTELMRGVHPLGSLAPRDVVARAIDAELRRAPGARVFLDMTALNPRALVTRFPTIHARCLALGLDMRDDLLPVAPGAHYLCGGINVDEHARTNVDGLYAVGEAACTGLHGACRLASNSLLEAVVFGRRAADELGRHDARIVARHGVPTPTALGTGGDYAPDERVGDLMERMRSLMTDYVGVVRDDAGLELAVRELTAVATEADRLVRQHRINVPLAELRGAATVSVLIARAARERHESRGVHYNRDWPSTAEVAQESFSVATRPT